MAFENPVLVLSAAADAAMSSPFRHVKKTATGVALAGVGEVACGVLQNKPAINGEAAYMVAGVTRLEASAAITVGTKVSVAANGKARTAVATDHVTGIALEAASADGDVVAVLLTLGGAPLP